MHRSRALGVLLACACCAGHAGCASYQSALGFRARRAVLEGDAARFPELMEEAASTRPSGPRDNPKKTVLTHFLDLAADPRFFPYIEDWRRKGWVDEDMTCSIYRAHARADRALDPAAARRSVEACLATARAAATRADRAWQVDDCLDEASFLTETSTAALVPFLRLVADPNEPLRFRAGLLHGMTNIPIAGASREAVNDAGLGADGARGIVENRLSVLRPRFVAVIEATRPFIELPLLAGSTALGAAQIEHASQTIGRSFIARFATSTAPDDPDLSWAWIRALKNKKPVLDLTALGLWNRDRETRGDVFWYLCTRPRPDGPAPPALAALGPVAVVDAISVRAPARAGDPDAIRRTACLDPRGGAPYPAIAGPFPAESIGRAAALEATAPDPARRAVVVLARRVLIPGATTATTAGAAEDAGGE